MLCLAQEGKNELAGFGISSESNPLLVEEFVLVKHFATPATFEFCPDAMAEHMEAMAARGISPDRCMKIYIHTHPHESADPSHTDWNEFADFAASSDFAVMFIMARGGLTTCTLRIRMLEDLHHSNSWGGLWVDKRLDTYVESFHGVKNTYTTLSKLPPTVMALLPFEDWLAEYGRCAKERWEKPSTYYRGYSRDGSGPGQAWLDHNGVTQTNNGGANNNSPLARVKAKKAEKKGEVKQWWTYDEAVLDINPLLPSPDANLHYIRLLSRAQSEDQAKAWWARRNDELCKLDRNDAAMEKLVEHIKGKMLDDDKSERMQAWYVLMSRTQNDIAKCKMAWEWVNDNAPIAHAYMDPPDDTMHDDDAGECEILQGLTYEALQLMCQEEAFIKEGQTVAEQIGLWCHTSRGAGYISTVKMQDRYRLNDDERGMLNALGSDEELLCALLYLENRRDAALAAEPVVARPGAAEAAGQTDAQAAQQAIAELTPHEQGATNQVTEPFHHGGVDQTAQGFCG